MLPVLQKQELRRGMKLVKEKEMGWKGQQTMLWNPHPKLAKSL
jgi:hypothetical protein